MPEGIKGLPAPHGSDVGDNGRKLTAEEKALIASLPPDFIRAHPKIQSRDEPVLDGCSMKRGDLCKTRIDGVYRLTSVTIAAIEIGAYDDNATTPTWSFTLPNAHSPGTAFFADPFYFRVSPTAKTMTFHARLIASDGRILARSTDDRVFPIP